ncbi:small nuclear ribonucleoprotein e [Nannochloropsis gaditana]|uniref:Small nuclear ribonucleoprotein E n=2 Tax=Monodopsidaceae TaxID=425072 RepID=W7T2M8_9STRA|nr:small nuclear ribonucleoprotein e [Nannochloropsis gaditana]
MPGSDATRLSHCNLCHPSHTAPCGKISHSAPTLCVVGTGVWSGSHARSLLPPSTEAPLFGSISSFPRSLFDIMSSKVKKVMTQPISVIFRMLQGKQRLQVWLYEQTSVRMEGKLIGFDEYMNVVLDEAEEVDSKKGTRKALGRILLKGDAITLIQHAPKD